MMGVQATALRRGDAAFVVGSVSVAHFLSHVFLLAYPPLFPLLATEFDVTTTQLGLLVTAIYIPQLLLQLPLGEVVDRVGAKWVLVGGLTVTALSIGASGLATSYWILLGCAFVSGIGQSVFHPADYALLGTVTTTETEGKGFSAHTFGGYAGFAAAPLAIGSVGIAISWNVALVGAGAVGVLAAAALALTMAPVHAQRLGGEKGETEESASERDPEEGSSRVDEESSKVNEGSSRTDEGSSGTDDGILRELATFVKQPDLLLVFLFYLLSMMALVGLQSFTTVLAVDDYGLTEGAANTLLTVHLAATAVGVVVGGPLADRASFRKIVVGLFVIAAVGMFVIVAGTAAASAALAFSLFALVGFLFGLALPSRDKFANSVVDPDAVGKSFGFFFTGLSLGAVMSPALLGYIIDIRSATAAFVVVGILLVLAASVVVVASTRS